MDTSTYLFAGYTALWIIPTIFLFFLVRKIAKIDTKLNNALDRLADKEEIK